MIYVASDHAGWHLKKRIVDWLKVGEYTVEDLGPAEIVKGDDYTDYAQKLSRKVLLNGGSRGILICDTGIGMSIAANRFAGIRAALVFNEFMARRAREHNDANVLVLGAELNSFDELERIMNNFLNTDFSGEERHTRRIEKIESNQKE